jgi:branched-chain amino acid transport system permease protein
MALFVQELISGVSIGAVYATLALALVVIYRAAGIGNFAQGAMATASAYVAWEFTSRGVPIVLALIIAAALSFVVSAFLEFVVIRRVQRASHLTVVIYTFGIYIAMEGLIGIIWGYDPRVPVSVFPQRALGPSSLGLSWSVIGIVLVSALVALSMYLLFTRTTIGLSMRAVVSNRESSRLAGINIGRTLMFGWALAGAIGAFSGVLAAPKLYLQPTMMDDVLLYAFAGAVLGGMTSYVGAIVGSVTVGVVLALVTTYVPFIGGDLGLIVAVVLIWAVLLVRPQGLFGRAEEHAPW